MQKSYFMGGGKTGMARRLSYDNPSLTLTCAPAQKQTMRLIFSPLREPD
jgi:DNA (cytosine-5)-methyltransferase 1